MIDSSALTHSTYGKNMKDKLHRCTTYFRQGDIFRYRQQVIIQIIKKINRIHQVILPNYQNIESKKNRTSTHTNQKRLRSPFSNRLQRSTKRTEYIHRITEMHLQTIDSYF